MSEWTSILWFVASLALLFLVTPWFSRRVQGPIFLLTGNPVIALYAYFALLLPGILVHELSHWVVAQALGMRTGKLSLRPRARRDGRVQMGALEYQRVDALRESVVGLAPLLAGTAVVLLIAHARFGLSLGSAWDLSALPGGLLAATRTKDAWLWIYLLAAVSNAMLPSASDRASWRTVSIYSVLAALGVLGLYALGAFARVPDPLVGVGLRLQRYLALAFTVAILLDVAIGAIFWAVEGILGLTLRRRLEAR